MTAPAGPPVVETRGLTRRYPGERTAALTGVDLVIGEGELVAVMGPSGCGKSTLLNILGLLDSPTDGTYELFGRRVHSLPEQDRTRLRRDGIGFVFQSFELIAHRTVVENVAVPLQLQRAPRTEARDRARAAVESVGLQARAHALPAQLSGGERQRVAIARALVTPKRLMLCDEPTGNLDSANAAEVLERLGALPESGTAVVIVTHDPGVAGLASRQVRLRDGVVVDDRQRRGAGW